MQQACLLGQSICKARNEATAIYTLTSHVYTLFVGRHVSESSHDSSSVDRGDGGDSSDSSDSSCSDSNADMMLTNDNDAEVMMILQHGSHKCTYVVTITVRSAI